MNNEGGPGARQSCKLHARAGCLRKSTSTLRSGKALVPDERRVPNDCGKQSYLRRIQGKKILADQFIPMECAIVREDLGRCVVGLWIYLNSRNRQNGISSESSEALGGCQKENPFPEARVKNPVARGTDGPSDEEGGDGRIGVICPSRFLRCSTHGNPSVYPRSESLQSGTLQERLGVLSTRKEQGGGALDAGLLVQRGQLDLRRAQGAAEDVPPRPRPDPNERLRRIPGMWPPAPASATPPFRRCSYDSESQSTYCGGLCPTRFVILGYLPRATLSWMATTLI